MQIIEESEKEGIISTRVSGIAPYSLFDTLECGQCFRFERIVGAYPDEYEGVAMGKYVHVAQDGTGDLIFIGESAKNVRDVWVNYFALDLSLEEIRKSILKNAPKGNKLYPASEAAKGIAILRQDAWESLFSYIISQNNNIPRIKKIIKTVSECYGRKTEDNKGFLIPTPEDIVKNPDLLDPSHPGFRKRYLIDAATKVARGEINLEKIRQIADYSEAKAALMRIVGVGSKVADCVLLYGMNRLDAFPIDVWIRRAMTDYFDDSFTVKELGEYAGVAQQYIFHYTRNG